MEGTEVIAGIGQRNPAYWVSKVYSPGWGITSMGVYLWVQTGKGYSILKIGMIHPH
jgi:hypothetical protein